MAVAYPQTDNSSSTTQIPLVYEDQEDEANLSRSLNHLETFLRVFGFCQYSFLSIILSWLSFLLLGIALPAAMIKYLSYCTDCEKYQINTFEIQVLVFQSLVATISLVCISHSLRKYGARKFLFVDRYHGHLAQFRDEYVKKINGFFRLLVTWVLPFLVLKIIREAVRVVYAPHHSWGCALFNLVCNFQVIHFENYGKLLERDLDITQYIEEHIRLTHYLSKISHRFRIFFILELLVVTASQIVAIFQTTWHSEILNLINGGDFVISSIVELVGLIISLHAAAKITHRAQGTGSVAAKWHSIVTCAYDDTSQVETGSNCGSSEAANTGHLIHINYSESDLEAVDYVPVPTTTQLASYMSTYHKRQSFVTYLQSNPGGFSVFGWRVDRTLINTIFFLEISLVLFVLGKTITIYHS
ncbi:NADH-ubiquinone oxidoreductase [Salix suchowensis]|nr:NADH-ubiquinone oxidoreductase [Salix suchowensis]